MSSVWFLALGSHDRLIDDHANPKGFYLMVISGLFRNDNDEETMDRQHDVYHVALRIVVETTDRYAEFAKRLLGDERHDEWGIQDRSQFDHRTLQNAHDLLAAIWRYKNESRRQLILSFPDNKAEESTETLWLRWLREELESWVERPDMIRHVQIILANQDGEAEFRSEKALVRAIKDKFYEVPWGEE